MRQIHGWKGAGCFKAAGSPRAGGAALTTAGMTSARPQLAAAGPRA